MRGLQNEVIRKLRMPPPEYIEAFKAACSKYPDADAMLDGLLVRFRQVDEPYRSNQDVSLRYFDANDVQNWAAFLISVLPSILDELRRRAGRPPAGGS
jgi:hypothetical protein